MNAHEEAVMMCCVNVCRGKGEMLVSTNRQSLAIYNMGALYIPSEACVGLLVMYIHSGVNAPAIAMTQ